MLSHKWILKVSRFSMIWIIIAICAGNIVNSVLLTRDFCVGSFCYDFIELLGVFSAVYFFLKKRFWISTLLIFIFSFNKETFFLVSLGLYFLHDKETSFKEKLFWLTIQFVLSFPIRIYIMSGYTGNSRSSFELIFIRNLLFWIDLTTYLFRFTNLLAPGFTIPSIENILFLIPIYLFFKYS